MTKSGKLCLRFTDFENNIGSIWKSIQTENNFCDVTLACGSGQVVQAHKVILSSCSPILRSLLIQNPHQHPLLYLRGIRYSELVNLLDFIYQGEVDIDQEDLPEFLSIAQELQIKGLILNDLEQSEMLSQHEESPSKRTKKTSNKSFLHESSSNNVAGTSNNVKTEKCESFMDQLMTSPDVMLTEGEFDMGEAFDGEDGVDPIEAFDGEDGVDPIEAGNVVEEYGEVGHDVDGYVEYLDEDGELSPDKKIDENGKTVYHCKECDYCSKSKGNFTQHINSMHKGKFFPCELCGYKAKHRSNLKKHQMAMHEGVRYPCELCEYQATQKKYLRVHVSKVHTAPQVNMYSGSNEEKSPKSSRKPRQAKAGK